MNLRDKFELIEYNGHQIFTISPKLIRESNTGIKDDLE